MDAKANALKRLRLKPPTMHAHNEMPKPMSDAKKDDDKGDLAPDVKKPMISGELDDSHMGVMHQLMDQISHPGRDAMTLDEKGGEKMALLMKHKKMK
jgi:hypothetical protein